jgi:hypothetical protein
MLGFNGSKSNNTYTVQYENYIRLPRAFFKVKDYNARVTHLGSMITIFCDFRQFYAKILAFLVKVTFLQNLALF